MALRSRATAQWQGALTNGAGTVSAASSAAFQDVPVSWASRTEQHAGKSSPEELLAAAHASCFAMALSAGLGRAGTPPDTLRVEATVTFDLVNEAWKVVSSDLVVTGRVPGADPTTFAAAAEAAKDGCPISTAIKHSVTITVTATLE
ncbi:MAG: OsmC family peroxiredoxin [Dehalococcoidia bacterium]|nr:OsmC family peroxiredoxin [Dehalococcoidia bacterium]